MPTRCHVHEEALDASQEEVFRLLVTPSAIREWWSAATAIVMPVEGGTWAAAWGPDEDAPDYVTSATLEVLDPPRRLVFVDYKYYARSGPLPFSAEFTTEFTVEPAGAGARLRVRQDGFPEGPEADAFLAACDRGWRDTFSGIRRYLAARASGA